MKICFSKQMKKIDETSINKYNIPGVVLMENAGSAVTREIYTLNIHNKKAVIFCGTGNNGGDGFVIARHLINNGWSINVLLCGDESKLKGDALVNYKILKGINADISGIDIQCLKLVHEKIEEAGLIVDALLGTGFKGKLSDLYLKIISMLNASSKYIVSVDIPSGLNADTGLVEEAAVKADMTISFQLPKLGLIINTGPECCGILKIVDISIPKQIIEDEKLQLNLVEAQDIKTIIKKRSNNTHKGTYGRVLVIAGSTGMSGAGVMSSSAALKSGSGIVVLAVPRPIQSIVAAQLVEVMTIPLESSEAGTISFEAVNKLKEIISGFDSVLIGPGLTVNQDIIRLVQSIIESVDIPLIIDADALNAVSCNIDVLSKKKGSIILTPHPGEMAKLMNCSIKQIQENRIEYARELAERYGIIVVLKGFRTITVLPDGEIYINPNGNPGMATAGSGDALAGIIAGLAAQNIDVFKAAIAGVFIHGAAGDTGAANLGEYGLTACDIISQIPHTIKNIAGY